MNQEQNITEVDNLLPPSQIVELVDHAIFPAPVNARVQLYQTARFATAMILKCHIRTSRYSRQAESTLKRMNIEENEPCLNTSLWLLYPGSYLAARMD